MASLIKRSNGIYYSITYVGGRRVWKSTGTPSRSKALTLEQFRTPLFGFFGANLASTTVMLYNQTFNNFNRIVGDLALTRYTPLDD